MSELLATYWPVFLAGLVIALITGWLMFRPRQRVGLTDSTPRRPHMPGTAAKPTAELSSDRLESRLDQPLPVAGGAPDDLRLLKGVGPKMATMLNQHGIVRFDQLAQLTDPQVEALDASLGAFSGRFGRDRIVEQARLLASGDQAGFEAKFGKL